jgi:hypothetical protein
MTDQWFVFEPCGEPAAVVREGWCRWVVRVDGRVVGRRHWTRRAARRAAIGRWPAYRPTSGPMDRASAMRAIGWPDSGGAQ